MSNYHQITQHPETGEMVTAEWLDDHFGRHRYGVRFPDGKVFPAELLLDVSVRNTKHPETGEFVMACWLFKQKLVRFPDDQQFPFDQITTIMINSRQYDVTALTQNRVS